MALLLRWLRFRRSRQTSLGRFHMLNFVASEADLRLRSRFLEMMSAERGAAKNSIAAYTRDLETWLGFLAARKVTVLMEIGRAHV